jgi:outer membrane biosynthesis protein TonB
MNRFTRIALIIPALSLGLVLAGCESFDPTAIFDAEIFNTKKKLPGERRAVFPEGTPGVPQGVPQELVKGYQPAEPEPPPQQPPAEAKPKPKPKPKVVAKPKEESAPTAVTVRPSQPQPQQSSQPQWPDPPPQQQQRSQSGGVAWPDPPPIR